MKKHLYLLLTAVFCCSTIMSFAQNNNNSGIKNCRLDSTASSYQKVSYTYYPDGNLCTEFIEDYSQDNPNSSITESYSYDQLGRTIQYSNNSFDGNIANRLMRSYGYDEQGKISSYSETTEYENIGYESFFYDNSWSLSYDMDGILIRKDSSYKVRANADEVYYYEQSELYENGRIALITSSLISRDTQPCIDSCKYTYNGEGLIDKISKYNTTGGNTEDVYTYNDQKKCVSIVHYVTYDGALTQQAKTEYSYDGDEVTQNDYEYSWGEWTLTSSQKTKNEKKYDTKDRLISNIDYTYTNGSWQKTKYAEYTYAENDSLIKFVTPNNTEEWTYDASGRLTSYIKNNTKKEYVYDAEGNQTEYNEYSLIGSSWTLQTTDRKEWAGGLLKSEITNNTKETYEYDFSGNLTKKEEYTGSLSADSWTLAQRIKYFYDTEVDTSLIIAPKVTYYFYHVSKPKYYVTYQKLGSYTTTFYYSDIKEEEDPVSTGIAVVSDNSSDDIYNINGQRLYAPRKGINIINGKAILVK